MMERQIYFAIKMGLNVYSLFVKVFGFEPNSPRYGELTKYNSLLSPCLVV